MPNHVAHESARPTSSSRATSFDDGNSSHQTAGSRLLTNYLRSVEELHSADNSASVEDRCCC